MARAPVSLNRAFQQGSSPRILAQTINNNYHNTQLLNNNQIHLQQQKAGFSTTSAASAPKDSSNRELARKRAARSLAKKRIQAKTPPQKSPLYADLPTALRYLRAAEVGRSNEASTITVTSQIVAEKGTQPLQGAIRFPKPLKDIQILVFTSDAEQAQIAKDNGAALVGGAELIEQIKEGTVALGGFNKAFATPELIGSLAPLARSLGPKGLMPNAKKGTVTSDLETALSQSLGTMPFKQKSNLLSIAIGRASFSDSEIIKNVIAASQAVKSAATTVKSKKPPIIGETTISSTNGPGFVISF